jgi:ABC-type Zn uptake system ZnuABC Zn-binding protein ZnuA
MRTVIKNFKEDNMKNKLIFFLISLFGIFTTAHAGTIKVVTTTTDLKSITELIGGDKVSVSSIATGYQNPHFVDPKPSYIIGLSKADMFVTVGLDLETGWSPQLLTSSRNTKIQKGAEGYVDASQGIGRLQTGQKVIFISMATRTTGSIH